MTNNTLILGEKSLQKTQLPNISELINSFKTIYFGKRGLSGSKIREFYIKDTDIYPKNNRNFAIEDTPYLQSFVGELPSGYQTKDGILYTINSNDYIIQSLSSGFLNKVIENTSNDIETGNILRLSKLKEAIFKTLSLESTNTISFTDYCMLSAQKNVHTLVLDNDNKIGNSTNDCFNTLGYIKGLFIDTNANPYAVGATTPTIEITEGGIISTTMLSSSLSTTLEPLIDIAHCGKLRLLSTAEYTGVNTKFSNLYNLTNLYYENTEDAVATENSCIIGQVFFDSSFINNNEIELKGLMSQKLVANTNAGIFKDSKNIVSLNLKDAYFTDSNIGEATFSDLKKVSLNNNNFESFLGVSDSFLNLNTLNYYYSPVTEDTYSYTNELNAKLPKLRVLNIIPNSWYASGNGYKKIGNYIVGNDSPITIDIDFYIPCDNEYTGTEYSLKKFGDELGSLVYSTNFIGTRFANMEQLKDIYIPQDFVRENDGDPQLVARAFYATTPKNIYIYINEDEDFLPELKNESYSVVLTRLGWTNLTNRLCTSKDNLFPYNSKIYLYNLGASKTENQTRYLFNYTSQRNQSLVIGDLELWNQGEIEGWENYVNNETQPTVNIQPGSIVYLKETGNEVEYIYLGEDENDITRLLRAKVDGNAVALNSSSTTSYFNSTFR